LLEVSYDQQSVAATFIKARIDLRDRCQLNSAAQWELVLLIGYRGDKFASYPAGLILSDAKLAESRFQSPAVIKDITVHPARKVGNHRRYVFSRIAISTSSTNNCRITFSCSSNLLRQTVHRRFLTISRSLLQSNAHKRVTELNTPAIEEAKRQWRLCE
jgi:hypothetical protein